MERKRVAVLASGGLDSAVLLVECASRFREVFPVYVRCGLHWEETEREFLGSFLSRIDDPRIREPMSLSFPMEDLYGGSWYLNGEGVPGYDDPDEHWEIPGRNLILIAKTAVWARMRSIGSIAIATLKTNPFSDASERFFSLLESALTEGLGAELEILRPFAQLTKSEVIRRGMRLPLELTLSCGDPDPEGHCGVCGKCRERIEAFAASGVRDATVYRRRPL